MGIIAQKPSIAHLLYRQILQSSRQNPGKVSSSGKDFSSHDITGQKKIPALASRDLNVWKKQNYFRDSGAVTVMSKKSVTIP